MNSDKERPTNKSFRDNLIANLKVSGVPQEELQTQGNLVWWEKEKDSGKEASSKWRF